MAGLTSRLLSVSSSVPRIQMVPMSSLLGLEGAYAHTILRWAPSTVMFADTAPPSSSFGAPRVLRMRAIAGDWSSPLLSSMAVGGPWNDDRGSAPGDLLARFLRGVRNDKEELHSAGDVLVCLRCGLVEVVLLNEDGCDRVSLVLGGDGFEAVS